jgi:segregation and condensation protein B
MNLEELTPMVEAMLMASEEAVSTDRLLKLLSVSVVNVTKDAINSALQSLAESYEGRGVELVELASGYRFRARAKYSLQVGALWEERKPKYSKALLETLAIVAYQQPVTRGEIEHIRGVAVSSNIVRTLLEREWIKVIGHRDVPGRPAVFGTTKEFLDYFGLKKLEELPSLPEVVDLDTAHEQFLDGSNSDELSVESKEEI